MGLVIPKKNLVVVVSKGKWTNEDICKFYGLEVIDYITLNGKPTRARDLDGYHDSNSLIIHDKVNS